VGLPDAFCKNTGHFDLSTVPDLNCVVFHKRHGENRETTIARILVGSLLEQVFVAVKK